MLFWVGIALTDEEHMIPWREVIGSWSGFQVRADGLTVKGKLNLAVAKAQEVRALLRPWMNVFYDEAGSIGRRYARQDEAGTPYCVTVDFDTLGEKPELKDTVTLRHRDDGRQERLPIGELRDWLLARVR